MKKINPIELFLWTFRRKEKDVVNLYDSLSDLMRLATGGDMLNFGYWDDKTKTPLEAQKKMCTIFGKKALLESNQRIVDVGSGIGSPSIQWSLDYSPVKLSCININFAQLQTSNGKVVAVAFMKLKFSELFVGIDLLTFFIEDCNCAKLMLIHDNLTGE